MIRTVRRSVAIAATAVLAGACLTLAGAPAQAQASWTCAKGNWCAYFDGHWAEQNAGDWEQWPGVRATGILNNGYADRLDHVWVNTYDEDTGTYGSFCLAYNGSKRPNWMDFPDNPPHTYFKDLMIFRVTWKRGPSCGGWGWPEHSGATVWNY